VALGVFIVGPPFVWGEGTSMPKLDHVRIAVRDYRASQRWYLETIGLESEFENARRKVAALKDDSGLTLLLEQSVTEVHGDSCVLYFQVDDVEARYRQLSALGVPFVHPPRKRFWGYGPELKDPDGYRVRLWDDVTMWEKG